MEMPPPRTEKDERGFLGRLQYISRFISKLAMTCEPTFKSLRKDSNKKWDAQCQEAFDKIKRGPPILTAPRPGVRYL